MLKPQELLLELWGWGAASWPLSGSSCSRAGVSGELSAGHLLSAVSQSEGASG